ncbi:MAG: CBS domain-containing protein [Myxococcales bacterium]|nr:CBS domain-containing protein [Myxococcales bacterium]
MIADDIMTRDPITVTEKVSIGEAMTTMSEQGIRHLPVVRGEDVVGILSDRDISGLGLSMVNDVESYDQLRARMSQPVTALMTGGVVTIDQDSTVSEVVELMLEEKLSAIPVVESGTQQLVGIVSYVDVLQAAQSLFD